MPPVIGQSVDAATVSTAIAKAHLLADRRNADRGSRDLFILQLRTVSIAFCQSNRARRAQLQKFNSVTLAQFRTRHETVFLCAHSTRGRRSDRTAAMFAVSTKCRFVDCLSPAN
jgi:hypothetical protein